METGEITWGVVVVVMVVDSTSMGEELYLYKVRTKYVYRCGTVRLVDFKQHLERLCNR